MRPGETLLQFLICLRTRDWRDLAWCSVETLSGDGSAAVAGLAGATAVQPSQHPGPS